MVPRERKWSAEKWETHPGPCPDGFILRIKFGRWGTVEEEPFL